MVKCVFFKIEFMFVIITHTYNYNKLTQKNNNLTQKNNKLTQKHHDYQRRPC